MATFTQLEGNVLLWIQENLRHPALTPIMKGITTLGDSGIVWIIITLAMMLIPTWLLWKRANALTVERIAYLKQIRCTGYMSALALILMLVINDVCLKNIFHRIRPYDQIAGLQNLIGIQHDFSFPSGHTSSSIAAGWVIYKELPKKYGIPAMLLAVLIAFTRLYVGVHFPTDILGGVIGILCAEIGRWIVHKKFG